MLKKAVLVTGSHGFVGSHLLQMLQNDGQYELYGVERTRQSHSNTFGKTEYGDLTSFAFCTKAIKKTTPDFVVHLAGQSSVAASWQDPKTTLENNLLSQLNLLEALRLYAKPKKVLIISTADVYGMVDRKYLPIDEETPLKPNSPYATSKLLQEDLALGYHVNFEMPIVIVRPFGHIGPGQPPKAAIASFIDKIAKTPNGGTIAVGNLKVRRDFSDVRDIVKAYKLALEKAPAGDVYNLGAGKSYLLSKVLQDLLTLANKNLVITLDKSLYRKHDIMETVCDYTKFKKATGWEPKIPMEQTLKDMWGLANGL